MRTIKFRAWDKINKRMCVVRSMNNLLDADDYEYKYVYIDGYSGDDTIDWKDLELMQYTGLKDKNGKEIYEGDILGYPNPSIRKVVCFGEYYFRGDEYGIRGNGFYLQQYESGKPLDNKFYIYSYPNSENEVIGNIYENPELLEFTQ